MNPRHAPATLRNREPILSILDPLLNTGDHILEIASGSGEHACYFCQHRPDIQWQASDPDPQARDSIQAWRQQLQVINLMEPLPLDVLDKNWPLGIYQGIVCINMIHISPWQACLNLLAKAQQHLQPEGFLYLYGPFWEKETPPAPSNLDFDHSLKSRNPAWGIRQKEELIAEADKQALQFVGRWDMPANNLSLLFRRRSS
ncbi:MAG: DUF938 domain-containing protein [Oligoflexus sp.]